MRIGILTSGGDCPGIKLPFAVYAKQLSTLWNGGNWHSQRFSGAADQGCGVVYRKSLSGLLNLGGTMLGTSREKPFKKNGVMSGVDKPALIARNIEEMGA